MVGRSSCPECGTILRIRDRSFVGRKVNCPDCKTALRVEAGTQDGDYVTRRLTAAELERTDHGQAGSKANRNKIALSIPPIRATMSSWINSPLTAAWLLAIAILSLFAILTLTPKFRLAPARSAAARTEREPRVESIQTPVPASGNETRVPTETAIPLPAPRIMDDRVSVSALEPANIDGPLRWPPLPVANEAMPEPAAPPVPAPVEIDVKSKMSLEITSYKQSKPVKRRELIETLREQLGAPIRYDNEDLGTADLEKMVTFELENTTIGGVINSVADAAGWETSIEPTCLRLKRKQPPLVR